MTPTSLAATGSAGQTDVTGLVSTTRPVGRAGLSPLLDRLGPDGFAWLRSGAGFVTAGVAVRIPVAAGPGRFEAAARDVAAVLGEITSDNPLGWPGTGPLAVGALPFEDHLAGELIVPELVVGVTLDGEGWMTRTGCAGSVSGAMPAAEPDGSGRAATTGAVVRSNPAQDEWSAAVAELLARIDAGELHKVVLAREVLVEAEAPFERAAVLAHLQATHPSCFTYAAGDFVGASPELLVARHGTVVTSRPMAGSVPRGADREEDERLTGGLSTSGKEAAEHRLLVDDVLAALAPVCVRAPVAAAAEVVRLATVSHLATEVIGRLAEPAPSALALAGRLHPTPAVGGVPRAEALRSIAVLEGFERGLYAGPVGWVDATGDGEWAVALRSATLDGPLARLAAGAGIVAGSDPEAEWRETEAKLAPMLAALGVTRP